MLERNSRRTESYHVNLIRAFCVLVSSMVFVRVSPSSLVFLTLRVNPSCLLFLTVSPSRMFERNSRRTESYHVNLIRAFCVLVSSMVFVRVSPSSLVFLTLRVNPSCLLFLTVSPSRMLERNSRRTESYHVNLIRAFCVLVSSMVFVRVSPSSLVFLTLKVNPSCLLFLTGSPSRMLERNSRRTESYHVNLIRAFCVLVSSMVFVRVSPSSLVFPTLRVNPSCV